jgi:radical SAM protein with 4Fe4S-binding SPASM domain
MTDSNKPTFFDGFPFILGWELTLACNLKCGHCGSTAGAARNNELTTEEALTICDQLPRMLVREVDFTGGEPLLREDWPLLSKRLQDHGITVKMVTNGLLLTGETAIRMREAGIAAVGVSVDGLEATHNYIRGRPDLFDNLMASIRETIVSGLSLTVITSVNHLNLHELPELMDSLLKQGVKYWRLQPTFPLGRARYGEELYMSEKDFLDFGDIIKELKPRVSEAGMEMRLGDAYGYFTELDDSNPPWKGCPAGLFSCGITSDGGIKGCLSLPDEFVEGNLRTRDFWDIWFDPDSFSYNRAVPSQGTGELCADCDKFVQCRGGCTAMSFATTGQLHNDPYCFYGIQARASMPKTG